MLRVPVDPVHPDPSAIDHLAALVRAGGVIAIPTDTLYGLAANPFDATAVQRIFDIKRRPPERAVPLIAADLAQVRKTFGELPACGAKLAARFWPGPVTLVLAAVPPLADAISGGLGTVGVRVPDHAAARALASAFGAPLTATSANISGAAPTADPEEVVRQLGDDLDGLLDAGLSTGGLPSTIVDVTTDPPALIRTGAVDWTEIQACLRA